MLQTISMIGLQGFFFFLKQTEAEPKFWMHFRLFQLNFIFVWRRQVWNDTELDIPASLALPGGNELSKLLRA